MCHLQIYNMVGKVPSFETGGASWFLNLTTADPLYTLPVLYSYTFWLNLEVNIVVASSKHHYLV